MRRSQILHVVCLLMFFAFRAQAQNAGAASQLYRTQLSAAEAFYRLNQIGEAQKMLKETDPALRGWEWKLLYSRTDRSARTLAMHRQSVTGLAVSHNGKFLASGSEDSTIILWDALSGDHIRTIRGHNGRVSTLDFSPSDRMLLSGSTDKTIKLWDVKTGNQISNFANEFTRGIYQATFSRSGAMIGAVSWEFVPDHTPPIVGFAKVLETQTGKLIQRFNTDGHPAAGIAFTPDDKKIVTGTWGFHVKQHDIATGATDWDHDLSTLDYYTAVQSVDISSDGKYVVQCGKDNRIRLLNGNDGTMIYIIQPWQGHKEWVNCVRFSPDGLYFASGSDDGLVLVWETSTGTLYRTFRGHGGGVTQVAWHPDGQTIYSASADQTVKSWIIDHAGDLQFKADDNGPWSAPVSPSGNIIATAGSDKSFALWDLNTGAKVRLLDSLQGNASVFSSDGKYVALGSGNTIISYDVQTGKKIFEANDHTGTVYGMAYHAKQNLYASAGDKTVRLWNASDGSPVNVIETGSQAYVVQFTPDESEMIVGCRDGKVKIYSTKTWQLSDSLQSGSTVFNVAVSSDGKYFVTGGDKGECFGWDLKKRKLMYELKGHTKWVYGIAFHPQLPYVITASYDRTAKIWDMRNGICKLTLHGFSEPLYTASVSQNGNRLVLTQVNGEIHVIDISED